MTKILIVVEGGLIQAIYADTEVEVKVIDHDAGDVSDDDILQDYSLDGNAPEAYARALAEAEEAQRKQEKGGGSYDHRTRTGG